MLAATLAAIACACLPAPATAASTVPTLVRDVRTGFDPLGSLRPATDIQEYVQPDTQTEPSIAVNPADPLNVVAVYQEGRIADGGDATNGFATSFDGGRTWIHGELPGLTNYPGQGGPFERASDAVVAFGPDNTVYANSLVFDFNEEGGLRSGMAVNVSKDGGRHWSSPVFFQDDMLGGTNDKNWIVVDNSDAPGHHKGRVYVVWDRVAPVVYSYCDHDCDRLENWLPTLKTLSPLVFPGQGIGAYPLVMKDGGLGIVLDTVTPGIPTSIDEPDIEPGGADHVFIAAPQAGSTPFPAPLTFLPPVRIASNRSEGVAAQRASDGLPAAAIDPRSGAMYVVWDDGRFRSDGVNDAVITRSTDDGVTWSAPKRVNPGPTDDHINHYNVSVAVDSNGYLHVSYRQRDQSGRAPLFTPYIDTFDQESRDGGETFTAPLKVDRKPSNAYYDAFSRAGSFEGDYEQTASSGGYTYVVRAQGEPLSPDERPALTPNGSETIALTEAGKGHQHQRVWVALVRDLPPTLARSVRGRLRLSVRRLRHHRARVRVSGPAVAEVRRVRFLVGRRVVARDRRAPFVRVIRVRGRHSVGAAIDLRDGRTIHLRRRLR